MYPKSDVYHGLGGIFLDLHQPSSYESSFMSTVPLCLHEPNIVHAVRQYQDNPWQVYDATFWQQAVANKDWK